jgi:CheY-like chemotaxis protein
LPDKRIIIIDNEVDVRRGVREGVRAAGFDVESAVDGFSALELLERGQAEGKNYHGIVTEIFLPDMEGALMVATLRRQYPKLPIIVQTRYGDDTLQEALNKIDVAYLEKPFTAEVLIAALATCSFDNDTAQPVAPPAIQLGPADKRAYLMLRLSDRRRALETYDQFVGQDGIVRVEAVRGDYDIVLQAAADTMDALKAIIDRVEHTNGVRLAGYELVEAPYFDKHIMEFLQHMAQVMEDAKPADSAPGFNTYLFIDLDRYQLERFYLALSVTSGIVSCDIAGGGSKIIVQFGTELHPESFPVLLRKMAEFDGVRRVREAAVIGAAG